MSQNPKRIELYSPAHIQLLLGNVKLDQEDYICLSRQTKAIESVENKYKRELKQRIFDFSKKGINALALGLSLEDLEFDFESIMVEHAIASMRVAAKGKNSVTDIHLSKADGLKKIFKQWEAWRKKPSAQQKKDADHLKRTFIHSLKKFWESYSKDFLSGAAYDLSGLENAFVKRVKMPVARAKTIVQTETTRYFNDGIKDLYSKADGVTHYLFAAIRDKRTTEWCNDRNGLVYRKDKKYSDIPPPIHWNCRSQILPLSPSNPKHLKLIEDQKRLRENNSPKPLPRGWKT